MRCGQAEKEEFIPLGHFWGSVPLCPLTFSQLREDKCFIIQRCLLPRQIQGWLWVLTTPDLPGRLGGDPKSSTFLPLQVRNVIGFARDSFRGSAGLKSQESQGREG